MQPVIDVYWSFRSPYSYLVTPDLLKLREDYHVTMKLRPVLPIALRNKSALFSADNPNKIRYIIRDATRRAQFLGLPFALPSPDPIVQDLQTFEVAEEQPYIYHLTALGVVAEMLGKGIDLAHAVSALIWGGTKDWHQGDHLNKAMVTAGLDPTELNAMVAQLDVMAEVEKNQERLEQAGHWGVPTMVIDGEPFFGQDRIDTLRWRLEQLKVPGR